MQTAANPNTAQYIKPNTIGLAKFYWVVSASTINRGALLASGKDQNDMYSYYERVYCLPPSSTAFVLLPTIKRPPCMILLV